VAECLPRRLTQGLFNNAFVLDIADIEADVGLFTVHASGFSCQDIEVGGLNFELASDEADVETQNVKIEATSLNVTCNVKYLSLTSQGTGLASLDEGTTATLSVNLDVFQSILSFASKNFSSLPANRVFLESCDIANEPELNLELSPASNDNKMLQFAIELLVQKIFPSFLNFKELLCNEIVEIAVNDPISAVIRDLENLILTNQKIAQTYVDPLNAEHIPWTRTDTLPADWVNFETSSYFNMAFDAFNSGFSVSEGSVNNTVSGYIRDFTDENGTFTVPDESVLLYQDVGTAMNLTVYLHELRLQGMDSIISFDPVEVIGQHTLGSNFTLKRLVLDGEIGVNLIATNNNNKTIIQERFNISLDLGGAAMSLAFLLGIDTEEGSDLKFGSVLKSPMECAFSIFKHFNVSKSLLFIDALNSAPKVENFVDAEVNLVFQQLLDVFHRLYSKSLMLAITGMLSDDGPQLINDGVNNFIDESGSCEDPEVYTENPYFDFAHDEYFQQLVEAVRSDIIPNINSDFMDDMTFGNSGEQGTYILQTEKEIGTLRIDPIGELYLVAEQVKVRGLNSVRNITFMATPEDNGYPYVLRNQVGIGGNVSVASSNPNDKVIGPANHGNRVMVERPVELSILFTFDFNGPETNFHNLFEFSFIFQDFYLALDIWALVNRAKFNDLSISQLLDFNCIFSRIDQAEIKSLVARFGDVKVNLHCLNCTSPGMPQMEERVKSDSANQQFTETLNKWLTTILDRLEEAVTPENLEEAIVKADKTCRGVDVSETHFAPYHAEFDSRINIFAVIGGIFIVMFLSVIVGCILNRHRKPLQLKERTESISSADGGWSHRFFRFQSADSDSADIVIGDEEIREYDNRASVDVMDEASPIRYHNAPLCLHPSTPAWARYGIICVLLLNIFLFIVGHLITCANVNIKFMLLGDAVRMDNFQEFSIGKSIKDMWDAGVYPLCFLIATLSGAWPYIKVLTMLYCWIMPARWLPPIKRGRRLMILDTLGKWSMIDVYVLLLFMVAFGLQIENPRLDILPDHFYSVYVFVDPAIGLISFTAAAMLSLAANNICLYYHRNAIAADEQMYELQQDSKADVNIGMRHANKAIEVTASQPAKKSRRRLSTWLDDVGTKDTESEPIESLADHKFTLPSHGDGTISFTKGGKYLIASVIFFAFVIIVAGASIPAFGLQVFGVVGMFMDIDTVTSWMPFSVFDLFNFAVNQALTTEVGGPGYVIGVFYLAFAFLTTAFIMPAVQLLVLAYLWLKPLTLRRMKWFYFLAEISSAWAAIDVFIVALLIGCLEMGQLSGFLLAAVCDNILPMINGVLVPVGFVQEDNATCLYIAAGLEPGTALLLTGAFFTGIVNQIILKSCHFAIHEREDVAKYGKVAPHHRKHPGCFLRNSIKFALRLNILHHHDEQLEMNVGDSTLAVSAREDLYLDAI